MTFDEVYKGYRISFQRGDRFAWIFAPGEAVAMNEIPTSDKSGNRAWLRSEARRIIEADIISGAGLSNT